MTSALKMEAVGSTESVGNHVPDYMVSHARRRTTVATSKAHLPVVTNYILVNICHRNLRLDEGIGNFSENVTVT
jgi:hypothetical protein